MPERSVTVRVPATSANLGPGFDAIGVALGWYADVTLSFDLGRASGRRTDPMVRMVLQAARLAIQNTGLLRLPPGLGATVDAPFPVGRGLGASAAARAAGLVGGNALTGGQQDLAVLLALGAELEGHADNMAPALFGGLQVVAVDGPRVTRVEAPLHAGLRAAGFIPDFSMPTQESRELLPVSLSRADAVHNSSRAALLVAALSTGQWRALRTAVDDRLHQRPRSQLFPRMYDLFAAATGAGAHAAYLSGGGSTIIALADTERAETVSAALAAAAAEFGVGGTPFVADLGGPGARIIARA